MYDALEIAKYVILHENRAGRTISNLRLQKLLYFIQAQFLASEGIPCFDSCIEAWNFGPVVPEVYRRYKSYGGSCITATSRIPFWEISTEHMDLIDEMLDACAKYSTTTLVSITHSQDPWKKAYANKFDNTITNKSIKDYFVGRGAS